ncbi:MAG: ABC-2 type transport system permease protein [Halioglobus sp.]|jgi:ABC-2 type transport system permease protein
MRGSGFSRRVATKEIRLFFSSPVAWLFLASFVAASLFSFFWVESFFARNIADIRPLFEWMPRLLIFLCAALTMRMWSDERRNGTLEHVLTQPVALWHFVLGKFRACFFLLLLALLSTAPLPITVALIANLDWGPVLAAYIATTALGAAYISIGLYVSARTDNSIVSLIGTVAICGFIYLLGSSTVAGFFDNNVAENLRLLSTGARFDSITRGVLDARDLVYYLSVTLIFLTLNVFALEKERWARGAAAGRHWQWRTATLLLIGNIILTNVWLYRLSNLRVDLTAGQLYSISQPTHSYLNKLQEPLLIRAYFSAKTHPLLSPLIPQLRDLIKEYELAGKGNVHVEFIDPAQNPALEREANELYGIRATPFQIADRYQSSLLSSYFNVLVKYGDEFETLDFTNLIEVKTNTNAQAEVLLRNPEFDITRAIKSVLYRYQLGGNLFDGINDNVELIAYVSSDELLPDLLLTYKSLIRDQLNKMKIESGGKFTVRFIEPEARDGLVARKIADQWGFKPMVAAANSEQEFFFYLTLADKRQVVQIPTEQFDPGVFQQKLQAGLKRFASGFTKTVSLVVPKVDQQMAKHHLGGPTFINLENLIAKDYDIRKEDLSNGHVSPEADVLAVIAPHRLTNTQIFAIDQFLMRGGTLILVSSPYSTELSGGLLRLQEWDSGLSKWLAHNTITIGKSLVLDEQNSPFPAPVIRNSGEYEFQDVQLIDYPYFIDIRSGGVTSGHPITSSLPQLTMAWASPVEVENNSGRKVTSLLRSSSKSWLSSSDDIMPVRDAGGELTFDQQGQQHPVDIGVAVQGRFDSWFAGKSIPRGMLAKTNDTGIHTVVERSPQSARIILYASNDFMDDQILKIEVAAAGTQYVGPLELFMNTLDWAVRDDELLKIRSEGNFNRTLPTMDRAGQKKIETINYALSFVFLLILAAIHQIRLKMRKRYYAKALLRKGQ